MVPYQAVSTGGKSFVEFFAAAAFDGAGHMFCADLQTGIETAVGRKSFRIRKPPWSDDMGKPCDNSDFANLRGTR